MTHLGTHWKTEVGYSKLDRRYARRNHPADWYTYTKRQARRELRRNAATLLREELFDPTADVPIAPWRGEIECLYDADLLTRHYHLFKHKWIGQDEMLAVLRLATTVVAEDGEDWWDSVREYYTLPDPRGLNAMGWRNRWVIAWLENYGELVLVEEFEQRVRDFIVMAMENADD